MITEHGMEIELIILLSTETVVLTCDDLTQETEIKNFDSLQAVFFSLITFVTYFMVRMWAKDSPLNWMLHGQQ